MLGTSDLRTEVGTVKDSLAALCAGLDPDAIPLPEVTALWRSFDGIERLAAGAKCRLARRVEESRSWATQGSRSPAEHLAKLSATTTGRARAALEASKRLAALPAADDALARGELSDQQASAIAAAAAADPSEEARLVALARRRDLRTLREECARVRARAEDDAQRAERLHRQRSLRTWTGADGSWNLSAKHTPEAGAQVEAALAPLREAIFQGARRAGDHESAEAYGADALVEMARRSAGAEDARASDGARPAGDRPDGGATDGGATDGGATEGANLPQDTGVEGPEDGIAAEAGGEHPAGAVQDLAEDPGGDGAVECPEGAEPGNEVGGTTRRVARSRRPDTKVIVLISYEALKRGLAQADETCEIAGVGPVPVATVRSLLGDAFGAAIVTNGVDVFSVAHLGRSVTAHQRSALEARGYRCEVPGCGSTTALEIDHIEDWALTFRTKLDALCWLCQRHHGDKTHRGWRLAGPPGDRRWVLPQEGAPGQDVPGPAPPRLEEPDTAGGEPPSLAGDPAAA